MGETALHVALHLDLLIQPAHLVLGWLDGAAGSSTQGAQLRVSRPHPAWHGGRGTECSGGCSGLCCRNCGLLQPCLTINARSNEKAMYWMTVISR